MQVLSTAEKINTHKAQSATAECHKQPLVSIITPAFNSSSFIEETAKSVLAQSYHNWEWLITDDGSTDDTWMYLKRLSKKDNRIKVARHHVNLGPAAARNCSIDRAKGKYLLFLDSDDLWLPEKIERHVDFTESGNHSFSFTAYDIVDSSGQPIHKTVDGFDATVNYDDMLNAKATMGNSTVLVHRDLVGSMRLPDMRTGQDYAFWLLLLKKGFSAVCLPDVLTRYRIRPGSISRNKMIKAKSVWGIYRNQENLNISKSMWCFSRYACRAIFR